MSSILVFLYILVALHSGAAQQNFVLNDTYYAKSDLLDKAPLGLSFEFFAFPEYVTNVSTTNQCLSNLAAVTGTRPRIRIGGTTQDRALYNPSLAEAVNYTVASPLDAPDSLTFGPPFFKLATKLGGEVTVGLNRQLNQVNNTIEAMRAASAHMSNLFAIELGNEPDLYAATSPIAVKGEWNPTLDRTSQLSWQRQTSNALGNKKNLIQAGVYLSPPTWSIADLAPAESRSNDLEFVASFCDHSYPQSACGGASTNLTQLMDHEGIVEYVAQFKPEAQAAESVGKPYFIGETNSATCGGGGISPQFGAALWILDYTLQLILAGAQRLYFHQGTVGNCPYCFWTPTSVAAPYYGAYFTTLVLSPPAAYVAELDTTSTSLAAYAILDAQHQPIRILLYNSEFYNGAGTRPGVTVVLEGLRTNEVSLDSLSAESAISEVDQGQIPTAAGLQFANNTCAPKNVTLGPQTLQVEEGVVDLIVSASEAVLLTW